MGVVAYLDHERGNWVLSVKGEALASGPIDEVVAAAHELIGRLGGGVVYGGPGPGVKQTTFRVEASATPAAAPAPAAAAPKPEPGGDTRAEVAALCTSYENAQEEMSGFGDPIETDIGLGTLRLEAAYTLERLGSGNSDLSGSELLPLTTCVESLTGGKSTERAVKLVDKGSDRVMRDVGKSLVGLKAKGAISFIVAAVTTIFNSSAGAGGTAAKGALQGGIAAVIVLRGGWIIATQAEKAAEGSLKWATGLGSAAEAAMRGPRELERQLLGRHVGATLAAHTTLALMARRRATLIIVICWIAIAIAAIAFGLGAYEEFSNLTHPDPIVPTTPAPFPE